MTAVLHKGNVFVHPGPQLYSFNKINGRRNVDRHNPKRKPVILTYYIEFIILLSIAVKRICLVSVCVDTNILHNKCLCHNSGKLKSCIQTAAFDLAQGWKGHRGLQASVGEAGSVFNELGADIDFGLFHPCSSQCIQLAHWSKERPL